MGLSPPGPVLRRSRPPTPGGPKPQKPRLRPDAAPGYLAFLDAQSSKYIHGCHAPPAPSHPRVTCQRLWTCFAPSFPLAPGGFVSIARYFTHTYSMSFRIDCAPVAFSGWLGVPAETFLYLWTDPLLGPPHQLMLMEASPHSPEIYYKYEFRVFSCESGQ